MGRCPNPHPSPTLPPASPQTVALARATVGVTLTTCLLCGPAWASLSWDTDRRTEDPAAMCMVLCCRLHSAVEDHAEPMGIPRSIVVWYCPGVVRPRPWWKRATNERFKKRASSTC
ncbi:unnamed protein product [Arctogadus glacialis]